MSRIAGYIGKDEEFLTRIKNLASGSFPAIEIENITEADIGTADGYCAYIIDPDNTDNAEDILPADVPFAIAGNEELAGKIIEADIYPAQILIKTDEDERLDLYLKSFLGQTCKLSVSELNDFLRDTSVIENVSDAVIVSDMNFNILKMNSTAEKLYGWKTEEIKGEIITRLTRQEYINDYEAEVIEDFFRDGYWKGEVIQYDKHGKKLFISATVSTLKNRAGENIGCIAINRDYTDEIYNRRKLNESEEMARALLNASEDYILLIDRRGNILDVNDRYLALSGCRHKKELTGKNFFELIPEDVRDHARGNIEELSVTKSPIRFTTVYNDRYYQVNNYPITDSLGNIAKIGIFIRDNTEWVEAEKNLSQTNYQYKSLNESIPGAVYMARLDEGMKISHINSNIEAITGYKTRDFLSGEISLRDIYHPDDRQKVINDVRQVLKTGIPSKIRYRLVNIYGMVLWVEEYRSKFKYGGRNIIQGYLYEITDLVEHEDSLQESELEYRALFENANDGILLMKDGRIIKCNRRALQIFDARREEFIGKKPSELSPEYQADGRPSEVKALERINLALAGRPQQFSWTHLKQSGKVFYSEISLNRLDMGSDTYILALVRDITRRKIAQDKLRAREKELKTLFDYTPNCILRFSTDLMCLIANPATETELEIVPEEIVGRKLGFTRLPEIVVKVWENALNESLRKKKVVRQELTIGTATDVKYFDMKITPEYDDSGKVFSLLTFLHNITSIKKAQKESNENRYLLERIMELSPTAFYIYDIYLDKFVYTDPKFGNLFGVQESRQRIDLDKYFFINNINEDDRRKVLDSFAVFEVADDSYVNIIDFRIKDKHQEWRWLEKRDIIFSRLPNNEVHQILGVIDDISDRKRSMLAMNEALEQNRLRRMEIMSLLRSSRAILRADDLSGSLREIFENCRDLIGSRNGYIALHDPDGEKMRIIFGIMNGSAHSLETEKEYELKGYQKYVSEQATTEFDNYYSDSDIPDIMGAEGRPENILVASLKTENEVFGHISLYDKKDGFDNGDIKLITPFCDLAAVAFVNYSNLESLRQSEQRFRTLVSSIADIVYTLDVKYRHTGIYGGWVRKWQLNPEMFIGKTAADLFGPEAARPHIEATERALQGEYVIYEWETEFEGNKVYVQTSLSPLYDGEGRVRGVVGLGRDITDAKETLSALHASEERFGQLFNKMMDGFVIFQPVYNEKGEMISCRYLDVNPAYEEFIGMKKQDLIGKKLHSIYPDSDVQWFDKYKEVVETGKPKTFNIDHDPTGKFFTARCYKLNPEQHEFCVSIADITETMQHRRALIESEARFRQLFNNMSNGVAVYKAVDGGEDFVFVDFNKAAERIENISKKELIGRRVTEAFPAVKKTNLLEIFRRVYRTGNPERDSQFFYQDDRIFGWRENYTYKLSTGEIVALYDDITERKQAEEEIKQLNRELEQRVERRTEELKKAYEELRQSKEKISEAYRKEKELSDLQSRFITMISHEYRTPLTVVLSSATLIERRHKKGNHEKIDKYVDKIKGAVDDLTKLLEDVLIIGRSDGKVKLNIQPVDAQNVTSEIIDDLKSMEEYSQKTELIINGDVSDFKTDIKLFRQIVINLLSNAFKFSPEDSQIKIIFEENKRIHKLTVIDHGSGIPEEDINKLFEPFHRGINAKEIQGTGLGMAIVDKCVKSLGAELSIESKSGEGTKATVTFQ